jgi:dUTPase
MEEPIMSYDLFERIKYLDSRGVHYDFQPTGEMLVATNPDFEKGYDETTGNSRYNVNFPDPSACGSPATDYKVGVKKPGDVGMDMPIRIVGMENVLGPDGKPFLQVHPEPPIHNYLINYEKGYVDIPSGGYAELPTALHFKLPDDAWGMIRPRSSTGWKRRLVAFEGTIDAGFTGQMCCLVHNPNPYPVRVMHDDSVSQLILVQKYPLDKIVTVDYSDLPTTDRGQKGFGSTTENK